MIRLAKAILEAHSAVTGEPMMGAEPIKRSMSPARKRRIWNAHKGSCEGCGNVVPMFGPETVYEHRIQLWVSLDDSDENIRLLCKANCDPPKTKADAGIRAKIKRIWAWGEPKAASRLQGRPFSKDLRKGVNGKVSRRPVPDLRTTEEAG